MQIVWAGLPAWREAAVDSRIGLPRLVSSSWNVDAVNSSSEVSKVGVPSLVLALHLRDTPTTAAEMPAERTVSVATNPASLSTLVDGMRRIRDQLAGLHA